MKRHFVLLSVMIAMFVSAVEATIVTTAMPTIATSLGNFSRYSWIFSSYLLMSTVTVLIYGKLSDRYGRKLIFNIGMSIFLVGSLCAGWATTMEQLIIFRLIQGIGAGALSPVASTIIGDIYSMEERAKIQGYLSSVWGIAAIVGPAIGGIFVQTIGWEYVFWMNIPLGLLAMFGITYFLREERSSVTPVAIDVKGAVMLAVLLSSFIVWLTEGGQSFARFSWIGLSLLLLVVVGTYIFIHIERRAADPIVTPAIWKHPTIRYANTVTCITGIILIAISSYVPMYVTGVLGERAIVAGFTLTTMSIGWPLASTAAGHILLRIGPLQTSLLGGGALVVGSVTFLSLTMDSSPVWAGVGSFWIGIGMGLTSTAFIVTIQNSVPYEQRGSATASNMFMRNFGNAIGAALFGALLNSMIVRTFRAGEIDGSFEQIQLLLTEESRRQLQIEQLYTLREVLHHAMMYVYGGIGLLALVSIYFMMKIPKGKVVRHDSDRV